MNLLTLVNALLTLNIRVSVQKADALYKALGLDQIAADLDRRVTERANLPAEWERDLLY